MFAHSLFVHVSMLRICPSIASRMVILEFFNVIKKGIPLLNKQRISLLKVFAFTSFIISTLKGVLELVVVLIVKL